jgi:uncharacterized protein (TIGR03437 family)
VDANENNVLSAPGGGWVSEGITGYLYCSPGDTLNHCATTLPPQSLNVPLGTSFNAAPKFRPSVMPPLVNETFDWAMNALRKPGVYKAPPFLIHVINQARMEMTEEPVSPGEIVSLTGLRLGPAEAVSQTIVSGQPLLTELAGVRVLFDGVPASVLFASAEEVRAIVPESVAGKQKVLVQLEVDGDSANPYPLAVSASMPGVYTADGSGRGQAAALNQDGSPNSVKRPASRGSVITIYVTGSGRLQPGLSDGALPVSGRLPKPLLPVSVQVGNAAAEVLYAGSAPGLPGLIQVNFRIPEEAASGDAVPVSVLVGDRTSQTGAMIAVN